MSKCEVEREREREGEKERRTETALPARGLSGLQAAEQWQETSAWNFSLRTGMRAPYPGSRGPAPPCGQQRRHSLLGRRGLPQTDQGRREGAHQRIY